MHVIRQPFSLFIKRIIYQNMISRQTVTVNKSIFHMHKYVMNHKFMVISFTFSCSFIHLFYFFFLHIFSALVLHGEGGTSATTS